MQYLPFAYLALTVFMGNPFYDMLHGIAVGHLFYFMADVMPQVYGKDLLRTPLFLIDYFGVGVYTPPVQEQANNPYRAGGGGGRAVGGNTQGRSGGGIGGHNWGSGGQVLGRN